MGYGLGGGSSIVLSFVSGATMMGCLGISLFFLRFWKKTSDRFFILFSISFGILAMERFIAVLLELSPETRPLIYLLRLFAFVLIFAAIVDKNRAQS